MQIRRTRGRGQGRRWGSRGSRRRAGWAGWAGEQQGKQRRAGTEQGEQGNNRGTTMARRKQEENGQQQWMQFQPDSHRLCFWYTHNSRWPCHIDCKAENNRKLQRITKRPWKQKKNSLILPFPASDEPSRYPTGDFSLGVTGHAPIGEYYLKWPDCFPGFPYHCSHCSCLDTAAQTQTWSHILTECGRYKSHLPSMQYWMNARNNDELLRSFLRSNPSAFTFEDLPPDMH